MNKFSIIAKSVAVVISMIGVGYANSDLANSSARWTGFYAGIDEGFVFNSVSLSSQQLAFTYPGETCNTSSDFSSYYPGLQVGYMRQFINLLVAGVEANINFNLRQKDILGCTCPHNPNVMDRFTFKNQTQSSIKGRLGRAINWSKGPLLPYLTAGAGFASIELNYTNEGGDYYSKNTSKAGALIGAGLEWSFRQNWSLRAEYSYVNYGNAIRLVIPSVYGLMDPSGHARVDLNSNNIQLAVNYWI